MNLRVLELKFQHWLDSSKEDKDYRHYGFLSGTKIASGSSQCKSGKSQLYCSIDPEQSKSLKTINPVSPHAKWRREQSQLFKEFMLEKNETFVL